VLLEAAPANAAQHGLRGDEAVALLVDELGYGVGGLFHSAGCLDVYLEHGWAGPPRWVRPDGLLVLDLYPPHGGSAHAAESGEHAARLLERTTRAARALYPGWRWGGAT
jgi:hypothetical protein